MSRGPGGQLISLKKRVCQSAVLGPNGSQWVPNHLVSVPLVLYQAQLAPETPKSCLPAMIFVSDSQNLESENLTRKVKNMAKIKKHLFFHWP